VAIIVAFCLVTRLISLRVCLGLGVFWSRVMAKAMSKTLFLNGVESVSALTMAAFVCALIFFFACFSICLEMSIPATSLTFSARWGKSRPVPQPASSMRFCFLRVSWVKAALIFASCSS